MQCPLCRSGNIQKLPPYYEFHSQIFDLHRCRSCAIIFVYPQPDEETIRAMYDKNYFESDYHCGHTQQSAFDLSESVLPSWVAQINLQKSARVLEIGCATGYTLHGFQQAGYDCTGIEISDDAARFAREQLGLRVIAGEINSVTLNETFDLIYLLDVFEHLPAPDATLQRIKSWLKPDGHLIIVIPTQTNTLFSRFGIGVFSMLDLRSKIHLPPYHLFEYRPKTFRTMLTNAGFSRIGFHPDIIPPSEIALRSSFLQNLSKKCFHYPNYILTKWFGSFGDRLTAIIQL
ncbi:class I SAM-dependent methyltransferase [bacterium]|nr:class I SAM-dependent methyltransferase [bacterium]